MHIRQELCSYAVSALNLKYLNQVAHDVLELQVAKLRWLCMQQMNYAINKKTVLEYAVVADAVTDTELMDTCMKFLLESNNR